MIVKQTDVCFCSAVRDATAARKEPAALVVATAEDPTFLRSFFSGGEKRLPEERELGNETRWKAAFRTARSLPLPPPRDLSLRCHLPPLPTDRWRALQGGSLGSAQKDYEAGEEKGSPLLEGSGEWAKCREGRASGRPLALGSLAAGKRERARRSPRSEEASRDR